MQILMHHFHRIGFCTIFILLSFWTGAQEIVIRSKAVQNEKFTDGLGNILKTWELVELDGLAEIPSIGTSSVSMQLGERNLIIKGIHQPLTNHLSKLIELGPGFRREIPFPQLLYFNNEENRLTIGKDFLLGEFRDKGKNLMVEPLSNFIPKTDKNIYVVYNKTDVIADEKMDCGVIAEKPAELTKESQVNNNGSQNRDNTNAECRTIEIAVLANSKTFQFHGSSLEATARYIASIYNLTEGKKDQLTSFARNHCIKQNNLQQIWPAMY